jgi:hypothetical protein
MNEPFKGNDEYFSERPTIEVATNQRTQYVADEEFRIVVGI